ncbi:hypothetical protein [Carp edema virus]|nr:hypothetical protein [Carp edema virus]
MAFFDIFKIKPSQTKLINERKRKWSGDGSVYVIYERKWFLITTRSLYTSDNELIDKEYLPIWFVQN